MARDRWCGMSGTGQGAMTPRQRNCLAWFRLHEPNQTMSGTKAVWTFGARTLDSLVRRGGLLFAPGSDGANRMDGVYRLAPRGGARADAEGGMP